VIRLQGAYGIFYWIMTSARPFTMAAYSYAVTSGHTSAPVRPRAVQPVLGNEERTGLSAGSQSALITALCRHRPDVQ